MEGRGRAEVILEAIEVIGQLGDEEVRRMHSGLGLAGGREELAGLLAGFYREDVETRRALVRRLGQRSGLRVATG